MFRTTVPVLGEPEKTPDLPEKEKRSYDEPVMDAFNEGVAPGGLISRNDIRLLICYSLKTVGTPVSRELLGEMVQEQSVANYFETMDAVSDLIRNGNLEVCTNEGEETELLRLTPKGSAAIDELSDHLPRTIRDTAVRATIHLLKVQKNARENGVSIVPAEGGGYHITFSLNDRDTSLMELKIFVADREQAELLKRNFLEDPAALYSSVLSALMVD